MSFVAFYSFLSYALIAAVTPGPNNILALSSVAAHGLRRSVPLLAGISAGFLAVMLLCGGAALVLARMLPGLAAWLVWPGARYILWLAWRRAAGGAGGRRGGRRRRGRETFSRKKVRQAAASQFHVLPPLLVAPNTNRIIHFFKVKGEKVKIESLPFHFQFSPFN